MIGHMERAAKPVGMQPMDPWTLKDVHKDWPGTTAHQRWKTSLTVSQQVEKYVIQVSLSFNNKSDSAQSRFRSFDLQLGVISSVFEK